MSEVGFDPATPLTPSGNLRRRQLFSRFTEAGATGAAALAIAVLAIVIYTVASRGLDAISWEFLTTGEPTGIAPALIGTGVIVLVSTAIAMPIGVLIAIYLTEFAGPRATRIMKGTLDLTNGLPSIIIGLFIFGLLIKPLEKQMAFAASVALAVIQLPLIARGSLEVLLLVPSSLREASDALGVSRWRGVLGVILPSALGGIVTATVLAVARAAGETAPLIFASSVFDASKVSVNPFEALPNIPVTIFFLSEEGNPTGFTRAWGASLVLISVILFASLGARALLGRNRERTTR